MRSNSKNVKIPVFSQTTVYLAKYPANSKTFGKIIGMGPEDINASRDYSLKWEHVTALGVLFCVGLGSKLEHWTVQCP